MPRAEAESRDAVVLDAGLIAEARALGIDAGAVSGAALAQAVREAKAAAWREENAEALAQHEARLVEHGHPLAAYVSPDNPLAPFLGPGPHWKRD